MVTLYYAQGDIKPKKNIQAEPLSSKIERHEIGRYEIDNKTYVIEKEGCSSDCALGIRLIVTRKDDMIPLKTVIENGVNTVSKFVKQKDKLILIGEYNSSFNVVTIMETRSMEVLDYFYCFKPSISTSGRYILSSKFRPRWGPKSQNSDLYLVYDLEKSVTANSNQGKEPRVDVGFPVYPQHNASSKSFKVSVPSSFESHQMCYPVTWAANEDICMFVDRFEGLNYLVRIDLRQERGRSVGTYKLDVKNFIGDQQLDNEKLADANRDLHLQHLVVNDNGTAKLSTREIGLVREAEKVVVNKNFSAFEID